MLGWCSSAGWGDGCGWLRALIRCPRTGRADNACPHDSRDGSHPHASSDRIPGQAAILTQYRAFFAALTPLSKMNSSAARRAAVAKLAVDPELTQLVGGIAAARAQGQVLYGGFILRPQLLLVSGDTAKLTDCQDSSKHGRSVAATGKVVTFGRANDLAMATMKRGSDGAWRMARIDYAAAGSCNAAG